MRIKPKTQGQKIADTMIVKKEEIKHTLSIESIIKICREDEQNQLKNLTDPNTCFKLGLKEEADFNNEQFNKGNMK